MKWNCDLNKWIKYIKLLSAHSLSQTVAVGGLASSGSHMDEVILPIFWTILLIFPTFIILHLHLLVHATYCLLPTFHFLNISNITAIVVFTWFSIAHLHLTQEEKINSVSPWLMAPSIKEMKIKKNPLITFLLLDPPVVLLDDLSFPELMACCQRLTCCWWGVVVVVVSKDPSISSTVLQDIAMVCEWCEE